MNKRQNKKSTINRLTKAVSIEIVTMYINYGMMTDVRDRLMKKMGWTACECLQWDSEQNVLRGKTPRKQLATKAARKQGTPKGE